MEFGSAHKTVVNMSVSPRFRRLASNGAPLTWRKRRQLGVCGRRDSNCFHITAILMSFAEARSQ